MTANLFLGPHAMNTSCIWIIKSYDMFLCYALEKYFRVSSVLRNLSLHKKETLQKSFLVKISSVNVTKSGSHLLIGHIYWRNLKWKTFLQCFCFSKYWQKQLLKCCLSMECAKKLFHDKVVNSPVLCQSNYFIQLTM